MRIETNRELWTIGALLLLAAGSIDRPALASEDEFHLNLESVVFEVLDTDVDTHSAKFQEYRDLGSGFNLDQLRLLGAQGERFIELRTDRVGRRDARYGMDYGVHGKYALRVDYNKIVHRFGNDATLLWNRTAPGTWEIADGAQMALQNAVREQIGSGITADFLIGQITPYLAAAQKLDLSLQRDRTHITFDLGKMGDLAWNVDYRHENRSGLRPYGGSFGFNNTTEIPEPIDYDTTDAELSGEWNGKQSGVRFGYRHSEFENNISTLVWDNPWVGEDGTSSNAYLGPNSSSESGSRGFADLAADNQADLAYISGRGKLGGSWWYNGTLNYNVMKQNDPLPPYTLNTAIIGVDLETGAEFQASDRSTLPVTHADLEVDVLSMVGTVGTKLGEDFDLSFRYRYYDYNNTSPRIEFPGYVRMHSVWEEVPRITVPYGYTKDDLGVELNWGATDTTSLGFSYRMVGWDREFREVDHSDEDIFKLTLDSKPSSKVALRASWENADRSIDGYLPEAALASFVEDEAITNQPGLRKFAQAARQYDDYDLSVQFFPRDEWNLMVGVSGRDDTYPDSEFGLKSDEILQYNFEIGYAPGAQMNLYLFGHRADRDVLQASRQSGGTLSTNPQDNWEAALKETWDTWGLGLHGERDAWTWDCTGRWSNSDGLADFSTPAGGAPSEAVDFGNYEDIELLSVTLALERKINELSSWGVFYLYEDYTIDSFILAGIGPYIPGSFLLAADNGNYQANVFGANLRFSF
jgi:MtrB/PioB family decaheme-associated outer membrane protein